MYRTLTMSYHLLGLFDIHSALASQFRMKKRRRLKSGAIPTIFHRPSTAQGAAETGESHAIGQFQWSVHDDEGSQVYKRRGAVEKRQRLEVYYKSHHIISTS